LSEVKKSNVVIRAFRAVADHESSLKFAEGHRRVLEAHGVKKVTSLNHSWMKDRGVFVILVESMTSGKALGGARVHAYHGAEPLPIEAATFDLDPKIQEIVRDKAKKGTGELCGLWNSQEVAGLGIGSFFATRAGVVICEQLGLSSLFALCAPYTVRWAQRVGCTVLTEVGNQGTFYYPKLDLLATAVLLRDSKSLRDANHSEVKRIDYLRKNLISTVLDNPPGKRFMVEIDYNLRIADASTNEFIIDE